MLSLIHSYSLLELSTNQAMRTISVNFDVILLRALMSSDEFYSGG